MSRFNTVVPVPLGEIRRIEGKLGASALAGTLLTATDKFAAGDGTHAQSEGATFALNGAGNTKGLLILMEQQDMVTSEITVSRARNSWGRAHVLKPGEEATVILAEAETVTAGTSLLTTAANGKVAVATAGDEAVFSAIEGATSASTGDGLRILARML